MTKGFIWYETSVSRVNQSLYWTEIHDICSAAANSGIANCIRYEHVIRNESVALSLPLSLKLNP